jgi:hypothetical protein
MISCELYQYTSRYSDDLVSASAQFRSTTKKYEKLNEKKHKLTSILFNDSCSIEVKGNLFTATRSPVRELKA